MKSTSWRSAAELIGVTAIVVSLVFVGIQLQQDRDLAQVSTFGSIAESTSALSELVQAHSDVWVRGLNGDELTKSELAVFISMIRAVEARYMNFIIRWREVDDERFDPERMARNFAYYVYLYPGLRNVFENELDFVQYRSNALGRRASGIPLYAMALPYLKLLDEKAPEVPRVKTYIIW
jgi:hypothetical protein